eukprot:364837-Chlamydomonas_euryale.AAC.17
MDGGKIDGWRVGCIDGWTDGCIDGWMGGWMDWTVLLERPPSHPRPPFHAAVLLGRPSIAPRVLTMSQYRWNGPARVSFRMGISGMWRTARSLVQPTM